MRTRLSLNGLLLCAALLSPSCGGLTSTGANGPAAASATAGSATSAGGVRVSGDPTADVRKAWEKFFAAKSFRGRMSGAALTTVRGDDALVGAAIEFVAPDRYHWAAQGQRERGEMLFIGKDMYLRKGGGAWVKGPGGYGEGMIKEFRDSLELKMARYDEIKFAGTDTVDGSPMLAYQYKLKDTGHPGKLWIGASDGLPHQIETETAGGAKIYFTYYDYNADIKIEPPI